MSKANFIFFFCCLLSLFAFSQEATEFSGPFESWASVQTKFKIVADGKIDVTDRLQSVINNLSNPATGFNDGPQGYMTIYLPAGRYRISKTLVLRGKIGVTIVGEDPSNTFIDWYGGNNDTMFWANGSAYFKVSRISWNANGRTGMEGIGIHWQSRWDDGKSRSFAPLNIEISDCRFTGGFAIGIGGGTFYDPPRATGSNDSEVTIRRCFFKDCKTAGIRITGYNALDYWVWDCNFLNCETGIQNSSGNYHAYRCQFEGSKKSDLYNTAGYYVSARECRSYNSKAFSFDEGSSCNPFKRIFQKNIVSNSVNPPVEYYHLGNVSLMDNKFEQPTKRARPMQVALGSWCKGNYSVLSVNNQYSAKEPISLDMPSKKIFRSNDKITEIAAIQTMAAKQPLSAPAAPAYVKRKVFEIPRGANADQIQQILDQAAKLKGSKAIVHFAYGRYSVSKTLRIAAGADIQIIGDGPVFSSIIYPEPALAGKYMLIVDGPSYISIRDIQFGRNDQSNTQVHGISFRNVDQKGSTTLIDQLYSSAYLGLFCDGLDYLKVEKNNSFFADGNRLIGGKLQAAGKGTFQVNCFGGQFADLYVANNAEFVAKDCWWEGANRTPLNITGNGKITIDGALISPANADSLPTINIQKFKGKISLMNMYLIGGISVARDNPQLELLLWNIHFYHKMDPLQALDRAASYKALAMGLSSQCFDSKRPACKDMITHPEKSVNLSATDPFILQMVQQDRNSTPSSSRVASPSASNIVMSRVGVGYISIGLHFNNQN